MHGIQTQATGPWKGCHAYLHSDRTAIIFRHARLCERCLGLHRQRLITELLGPDNYVLDLSRSSAKVDIVTKHDTESHHGDLINHES